MATRKKKSKRSGKEARRPKGTHRDPVDEHAATELVMYIENTSDLSPEGPSGQGRSVLLNALRKWRKGTYNPILAVRLFEYLAESGAKRYAKEMGSSEKEWSAMFNPATRHEAAQQLEASFRSSAEGGEYDHVDTRIGQLNESGRSGSDRLFIGVYPGGIVYADKSREKHGDYARCAFLDFPTLTLTFDRTCPADLRAEIERDAAKLQARRGEQFSTSASGHTVILGGRQGVPRAGEMREASVDKRAVEFFSKNAGYGYGPGETPEQGRRRGAIALANAEQEATARGWTVDWEQDPDGWDSLGDVDPDTVKEILTAVLRDEDGKVLASLGAIIDPDRAYGRVVEAELALEALSESAPQARETRARRRR